MPTALIFGGSGKVSQHLTRILVSNSFKVHSLIRSESQVQSLTSIGAQPIVQSAEDASVSDLVSTLTSTKPDVVIWSAGAGGKGGPSRTNAVDNEAAVKSFDACAQAGVKRYIIVSALDNRDKKNKPVPDWYNEDDLARSDKAHAAIGAYYDAKLAADKNLVTNNDKRGLEYTIVRPGGLSLDPATGKCAAGKIHISPTISREDVARIIYECIMNDGTKGLAFDCVGGNDDISTAISRVAQDQIDTFSGFY